MRRLDFREVAGPVDESVHQHTHEGGDGGQGRTVENAGVEQPVLQRGVWRDDRIVAELVGIGECDEHGVTGERFAPVECDGDRLGFEVEVVAGGVMRVGDEAPSGVLGEVVRSAGCAGIGPARCRNRKG